MYTANGKIFIESLVGNIVDKEISSILCVKYSLFAYKITFTDDSAFYFDLKPKTYLTQIINSETLTGAFIRDAEDNTLK